MNTTIDQDFLESSKCTRRLQIIIHTLKHEIDYDLCNRNDQDGDDANEQEDGDSIRSEYLIESLDILRQLEELSTFIDYKIKELDLPYNKDNKKVDYLVKLEKLNERIGDLKIGLREAQLISKRNELSHINKIRQELCYREQDSTKEASTRVAQGNDDEILDDSKMQKLTTEDKILLKNKTITQSLQTSHQLLQATLMQSDLNINELETSSRSLITLHDKYSFFNDVLLRTNGLVKQINASSNKERRDIYRALAFFALCCFWVLWRRLLRKPVRLVFWIFFKIISVVFWGVGKTKTSIDNDIIVDTFSESESYVTMVMNTVATAIATETSEFEESLTTIVEDIIQTHLTEATEVIGDFFESVTTTMRDEL